MNIFNPPHWQQQRSIQGQGRSNSALPSFSFSKAFHAWPNFSFMSLGGNITPFFRSKNDEILICKRGLGSSIHLWHQWQSRAISLKAHISTLKKVRTDVACVGNNNLSNNHKIKLSVWNSSGQLSQSKALQILICSSFLRRRQFMFIKFWHNLNKSEGILNSRVKHF